MKNVFSLICLVTFPFTVLFSQSTLFDETRVSSVYIEIPADSLQVIMTDVNSDHYFKALFIYDYGSGRDTIRNVGFRLRGNTSRVSKKKSFKISFNLFRVNSPPLAAIPSSPSALGPSYPVRLRRGR